MIAQTIIWVILWFFVLGFPYYLFKKHAVSYHKHPRFHVAFFSAFIVTLWAVYRQLYFQYFQSLSFLVPVAVVSFLFLSWLLVPKIYKNDYFTKKQRTNYQLSKFFEVLFQQVCFLAGLLTLSLHPLVFGLIFFAIHFPLALVFDLKFSRVPIVGSLIGGPIIAYLQSQGAIGFFLALAIHLLFWTAVNYAVSKKVPGIIPLKR